MSGFQIILGQHSLKTIGEESEQVSGVDLVKTPQPGGPGFGDVAVLKLKTPIEFKKGALPICLPDPSEDPKPGTMCMVAGWGATSTGSPGQWLLKIK